jgi:hypothetical protein
MPALRVQMYLYGNTCILERDIVGHRVVYAIHRIIFRLQQKRRGCLAGLAAHTEGGCAT